MKIFHASDLHGQIELFRSWQYFADQCDMIVFSGDMEPNFRHIRDSMPVLECNYQEKWVRNNLRTLSSFIGKKPFLNVAGNHTYYHGLCQDLRKVGVDATDLTVPGQVVEKLGFKFTGFPFVSFECAPWAFSISDADMYEKTEELARTINEHGVDVLIAHSPRRNVLDMDWQQRSFGLPDIATMIDYKLIGKLKAYLCGHVHIQPTEVVKLNDTLYSNAATGFNVITL